MMIYNFMFTAAPPLAIGAYEKRLHENLLSKSPRLYRYVRWQRTINLLRNRIENLILGSTWKRISKSVLACHVGLAMAESCDILHCR